MATKANKITALKLEFPTLKVGSDEAGYTELDADEYEATIEQWADVQLANEAEAAADEAIADQTAADKAALLVKLGITEAEARLLIGGN